MSRLGKSGMGREELLLEASSRTALRKGDWLYIPPYPGRNVNKLVNIELGHDTIPQLYNLKEDIGQQKNLAATQPEKLAEMKARYNVLREKSGKVEELVLE